MMLMELMAPGFVIFFFGLSAATVGLCRFAFGEAFDFINGRDMLRLLVSIGVNEVKAGAAIGRSIHPYRDQSIGAEAVGACVGVVLAAGQVSVGMGLWAVTKMSYILLAKMRRPKYYQQERNRRERLARERRRVRDRFTTGSCPKPKDLLAQYAKAGSEARAAIRFGSMLCDLEAFCDNSLLRNADGEIVGRNPGIKGWIRDNCPELLAHYKNAMRYKGLAEKFRQAAGAADPVPAAALVAGDAGAALQSLGGKKSCKITVRMKKANGLRGGKTVSGTYALEANALQSAWKCAGEILSECEGKGSSRLRSGTNSGEGKQKDGETKDVDRLRSGKNSKGGGEVTRLERILDARLGGMPDSKIRQSRWKIGSRWRVGGKSVRYGEESGQTSA